MSGAGGRHAVVALAASALLITAVAACDFSNYAPAGAIALTLANNQIAVAQGTNGSVAVTLERSSFADSVHVLVEGLPAGVTAEALGFGEGQTAGTLRLTAASSAPTGTATVTLRAHSTGASALEATAELSLAVQSGGPRFTLAFEPAILGVPQGTSRTSAVMISRLGGFVGGVELAVSTPPGVTAQLNPSTVFAPASTLTITASPTASTVPVAVTVTGTVAGLATQTASLTVNVTPAGGGPTGNVSVAFCPLTGAPIWVAFQDGSAPWVLSTPVSGVYTGQVGSRGGLAWVLARPAGGFELRVFYGTTAEMQAFGEVFCYGSTGAGKSVNVTAAGITASDVAVLGLGTAVVAAPGGSLAFTDVPDGALDIVGVRAALVGSAAMPNKLFIQRGVTAAAGSSVTVDFAGANTVDPVSGTVTASNLGSDRAAASVTYRTPNRTLLAYTFDSPSPSASRSFAGFPTSAGSFHLVQVSAAATFVSPDRMRTAATINAAVGNRQVTLGTELGPITAVQAGTSPPLRLEATIPTSGYVSAWSVAFTQSSDTPFRRALVQATAGYVGGTPATVTLAVPDLSTVAGYNNLWGLAEVALTPWLALGQTTVGFGPQGQWQEGATVQTGARSGVFSHH